MAPKLAVAQAVPGVQGIPSQQQYQQWFREYVDSGEMPIVWAGDRELYFRCSTCWQWSDDNHKLSDKHHKRSVRFAHQLPWEQVRDSVKCLESTGEVSGMVQYGRMLLWGGAPAGYMDTFCQLTSLDRDALEFAVNCPTPMPPRRLAPKQAAVPRTLGPDRHAAGTADQQQHDAQWQTVQQQQQPLPPPPPPGIPANQALETPNEKALREGVETLEAGHRGLREKGEMLEAGHRGLRKEIATLRGQLEELQKELRGSRTTGSFMAVSEDHVLDDAELHMVQHGHISENHGDRHHDAD